MHAEACAGVSPLGLHVGQCLARCRIVRRDVLDQLRVVQLARRSQNVVAIEVPNDPAVIRAKLNSPDAAGIRPGDSPDRMQRDQRNEKHRHRAPCRIVGIISVRKSASVLKCERMYSTTREDSESAGREQPRIDLGDVASHQRREQDREQARPAPAPCRPTSRCSPCIAAARAAAAPDCRRTCRRRATSRRVLVQKFRRANSRRSTTGCWSVSSHTTKSAKPTTATMARIDDLRRVEPVEILALVEHDLQRADPDARAARARRRRSAA